MDLNYDNSFIDITPDLEEKVYFNYHDIVHDDMSNGDGLRVVLFLSGCNHGCPGCQNQNTWSRHSGIPFTDWEKAEVYSQLEKDYIQGITFSGGDPLYKWNRESVGLIIDEIKSLYPDKDIWLYTGYQFSFDDNGIPYFEEVCPWKQEKETFQLEWISKVDVLIDGPFISEIRNSDIKKGCLPHWRGSSNQRVIDVNKSLHSKEVLLHCA